MLLSSCLPESGSPATSSRATQHSLAKQRGPSGGPQMIFGSVKLSDRDPAGTDPNPESVIVAPKYASSRVEPITISDAFRYSVQISSCSLDSHSPYIITPIGSTALRQVRNYPSFRSGSLNRAYHLCSTAISDSDAPSPLHFSPKVQVQQQGTARLLLSTRSA